MPFDLSRLTDLAGRIAVVTGGGTGIGLYIAKGLASNGAKVYITSRRAEVLEKEANAFEGKGALIPLLMDVTDEESIKRGVEVVARSEGKLDILVNNAGVNAAPHLQPDFTAKRAEYFAQGKLPYELESFEGWHHVFKTNTFAPFFVTSAFLDLLVKGAEARNGESSSVINISSAEVKTTLPIGSFSCSITKAALNRLSTTMAADLATRNIPVRINVISPGVFPNQSFEPGFLEEYKTKPFPGLVAAVPSKRWGTPEEMALTAVYIAAVGYMNGATLRLDGGISLVNV